MSVRRLSLMGVVYAMVCLLAGPAIAEERDKLLSEPGVYGNFSAFQIDHDWWNMDKAVRLPAIAEAKAVFDKYREKLAIDTFLLRGLSDHADFMLRVHAREFGDIQSFLVDLLATGVGKHLNTTLVLNGMTKKANYVPAFPEALKNDLKAPSDPGPKTYAIVIPIRKNAEWWGLDQDKRTALMQEHTEAALPYLKTVKRKLYHSSGLDDVDFITYFETSKMDDFHQLIIALEKVKENKHNRRFGHPTLIGTVKSWDGLVETLGR